MESWFATDIAFLFPSRQILGQLIYDNPGKVEKTLPSFRDAAARREDDADMWELLAELLAPRDPPGSLKAYQHVLDLHRKKESAVKVLREEHIASSRGAREKRKGKGSAEDRGMEDLFGSDDEDDGDAQEEGGLESEAEALFPNHVVPARLLNNAAVLLYRSAASVADHVWSVPRSSVMCGACLDHLSCVERASIICH